MYHEVDSSNDVLDKLDKRPHLSWLPDRGSEGAELRSDFWVRPTLVVTSYSLDESKHYVLNSHTILTAEQCLFNTFCLQQKSNYIHSAKHGLHPRMTYYHADQPFSIIVTLLVPLGHSLNVALESVSCPTVI